MKKILVVGYFGYYTNLLDGQTVKTRNIYKLVKEYAQEKVDYYDTQYIQYDKLLIFKLFWKVINCHTLFYLPGQNNLRRVFPVLFILSVIFRFKIHYFVVGGWLREFLTNIPIYRFMLRRIAGIHVETKRLLLELREYYNFENVDIFPNFRFFKFNPQRYELDKYKLRREIIRICFVSRVEESKGLDTLLYIGNYIKHNNLSDYIRIDFFGKKVDAFFDQNLVNFSFYDYKGVIQPQEVISTLRRYDALIFPTHYEGEGCPGILVEALAAGLPIIASNWKFNSEFVKHGVNGFLCDTFDVDAYIQAMIVLSDHILRKQMKKQSYLMSKEFSSTMAIEKVKNYLL